MATRQLPDAELLRKLLRYEPETGKLFWRERTPEVFNPCRASSDALCQMWNKQFANKEAFTAISNGYRVGAINAGGATGMLRAHRVIWCMVYGQWPEQVDHINQNRSDNRLENLRETDFERNGRNARLGARNTSGRIGVHWCSNKERWRAKIRAHGRYIDLGVFKRFEDACEARSRAEKHYGYDPQHGKRRKS